MTETIEKTLHLAKWETRFGAWLIDIVLVSVVLEVFNEFLVSLPSILSVELGTIGGFSVFFGANGLALFVYWTLSEGIWGQSAGKMVLNLRVTDRRGNHPDFLAAAVQAFGKAFFLPIDCLVGWLAMEGQKLRLTNRLSNTIVISVPAEEPEGVEYVIPEE
ncbi:RDD family protein [Haloarchaeobius sp. HME9146]|uniref:RDD family protein n=1 Tax=Haloarchaeobius sp. HME9146 TaxID=2978732 RepID=UPI0021BEF5A5|nr:RDD family protein [Haloarchaeobius sp. HME9146]MCT9096859.1 RDD family protein [Haloarchaeobius sp. HME9146]